jgi:hypothetical protein
MHNALRVGKYWTHIPGNEPRAEYGLRNEEESIKHILTDCDSLECNLKHIRALCIKLWQRKALRMPWPGTKLGLILRAPLADMRAVNGNKIQCPGHPAYTV